MKNINQNIKNLDVSSFKVETYMLETEIKELELATLKVSDQLEKLKEQGQFIDMINEVIEQFQIIVPKAYPKEASSPVIEKKITDLHLPPFNSLEFFKVLLIEILYRIYFSEGKDKVVDYMDADFFDVAKFEILIAQGICFPVNWLDQFIDCLHKKNAHENMILHNLTPEWLWPKCFPVFIELSKLSQEFQKNKTH